jgi:F0F1-type ATP synthase assembly protein I
VVDRQKSQPSQAVEVSRYLGIGMTWALSTGLFLYLGLLADRRFDTEPWLTLIGAFVGGVAGFYYMYHHLVLEPQRRARERQRGGEGDGR